VAAITKRWLLSQQRERQLSLLETPVFLLGSALYSAEQADVALSQGLTDVARRYLAQALPLLVEAREQLRAWSKEYPYWRVAAAVVLASAAAVAVCCPQVREFICRIGR